MHYAFRSECTICQLVCPVLCRRGASKRRCTTTSAEAGVPEQTLMDIVGHLSREMLEHYSHIRSRPRETLSPFWTERTPRPLE